jgi:hypothetical protein
MSNRPDWNEWILQKNAEAKQEELRKSESIKLEKAIQFTGEFGQNKPKHMGERAAAEHNKSKVPAYSYDTSKSYDDNVEDARAHFKERNFVFPSDKHLHTHVKNAKKAAEHEERP